MSEKEDHVDFVPCQVCDGKGWIANKDGTGEACEFCGGTGNAKHKKEAKRDEG